MHLIIYVIYTSVDKTRSKVMSLNSNEWHISYTILNIYHYQWYVMQNRPQSFKSTPRPQSIGLACHLPVWQEAMAKVLQKSYLGIPWKKGGFPVSWSGRCGGKSPFLVEQSVWHHRLLLTGVYRELFLPPCCLLWDEATTMQIWLEFKMMYS